MAIKTLTMQATLALLPFLHPTCCGALHPLRQLPSRQIAEHSDASLPTGVRPLSETPLPLRSAMGYGATASWIASLLAASVVYATTGKRKVKSCVNAVECIVSMAGAQRARSCFSALECIESTVLWLTPPQRAAAALLAASTVQSLHILMTEMAATHQTELMIMWENHKANLATSPFGSTVAGEQLVKGVRRASAPAWPPGDAGRSWHAWVGKWAAGDGGERWGKCLASLRSWRQLALGSALGSARESVMGFARGSALGSAGGRGL
jgi:hypothetical protein